MLEICIDSLESALNAIHGGADEIEVCSSLVEGGLTPSAGLVKVIQTSLNNILLKKPLHKSCPEGCHCVNLQKKPKINIMLRCRAGTDFCFSDTEMDTMLADLDIFKAMDVDRFVFGALNISRDIDKEKCNQIVGRAYPIPVTFHRAFDVCKDPMESVENIIDLRFNRLLTSGQESSAVGQKAISVIKELLSVSNGRIEVMPGAGVNCDNVRLLTDVGCQIVHSSCKKILKLPQVGSLSMGTSESTLLMVTDENHVRKLKENIISH